jgi:hypothetical protein
MNEKQMQFDWNFGLRWMVAYGLGILLLGMLAFASVWSLGEIVENNFGETATFVVVGALFGALIGLGASGGTALLLRRRGISAARWIAYSVIGGALGGMIGFGVALGLFDAEAMPEVAAGLVVGVSLGLPIGTGQWLVLRRFGDGTNTWPVISTFTLVLALMAGLPLGGEGREWLALGMTGLLAGAISGLGMMWLLRRQPALA